MDLVLSFMQRQMDLDMPRSVIVAEADRSRSFIVTEADGYRYA